MAHRTGLQIGSREFALGERLDDQSDLETRRFVPNHPRYTVRIGCRSECGPRTEARRRRVGDRATVIAPPKSEEHSQERLCHEGF
jgi:hypothetical protein